MELIDKMRGKVDKGEVFYVESTSRSVEFKGWKIRGSESSRERGIGIRVIVNGKIGTAATTDISPDALQKMLDNAISAAKFGEELELDFPGISKFKIPEIYDDKIENLNITKLADTGKELMSHLEKHRKDCDIDISINMAVSNIKLVNTEGFVGEFKKSNYGIYGGLVRVQEGDIYFAGESYNSTHVPKESNEAISVIIAKIEDIMQYADIICPAPPSGKVPVIFTPNGSYILFASLFQGINGTNIYTKTSPIYGKIGEKLFDEKLTIIDDGTMNHRPGSFPFDAEGLPKKKFSIIENGILKSFLFDLTTAKKAGTKSNGCANRSIFSPPSPSISNIMVSPGSISLNEMMADIRQGIVAESALGVGQGNIISGAFSNPLPTAFKIENGKIVGRVKNAAIAGNIYENLKDIAGISSDAKWFYGRYYVPYIRLDNVSVIGK